ncbi:MAG: hypothetical protein ACUVQD_02745 [Thermaceae bacterium]
MLFLHWLGLILLLLVGAVFFWFRFQVPLRIPLWGFSLPVEEVWLLGFGLGVGFVGLYLLALGAKAFGERRRLLREVRRLKEEVERLKAGQLGASPEGEHQDA